MDKYYVDRPTLELIGFTEGRDKGDGDSFWNASDEMWYIFFVWLASLLPRWTLRARFFLFRKSLLL